MWLEEELPGPGPVEFGPIAFDDLASVKRFVSEDAYINKALAMTTPVQLDGVKIWPAGHVVNALPKQ